VPFLQRKCACGNLASGVTGKCAQCQHDNASGLRAKPALSAANDPYEQEADRVAALVVDMSPPTADQLGAAPAPSTSDRPAPRATGDQTVPESVDATQRSDGEPLSPATRAFFEPRFGHDFSRVRVHHHAQAAASADALAARAYTIGEHIAFARGRYAPESTEGRTLLAHELTHVVQQARGGAPIGVHTKPDEPGAAAPAEEVDVITGADAGAPAASPPTATVLDRFVRNKSTLTKKHRDAIEQLAFSIWLHLSLYADAKATIAISGHTDTTGDEKHNSGLGTARADNVKAALVAALEKQGIESAKRGAVTTTSQGETRLRVPTGDDVNEPRNRRVEIDVTIEVKPPPAPKPPPSTKPLPGTPGGPKIWEVPGLMEELAPARPPTPPRVPKSEGEWLEEALKRDPLLKKLPKYAREKAIGALKDGDEKLAETIIDNIPFGDDEYKQAAKAAMKALLQTLKGRKYKPPPSPPPGLPELEEPKFPNAPGEKIFKLPPIRF